MESIVKRIKTIYGTLLILGTMLPYVPYFSLINFISFKGNLSDSQEAMSFLALLIIAAGIIFIAMDFLPEQYVKTNVRQKWLKIAKWVAIISIAVLILVALSLSSLSYMKIGFWLLTIVFVGLLFEKKIVEMIEQKIKK